MFLGGDDDMNGCRTRVALTDVLGMTMSRAGACVFGYACMHGWFLALDWDNEHQKDAKRNLLVSNIL